MSKEEEEKGDWCTLLLLLRAQSPKPEFAVRKQRGVNHRRWRDYNAETDCCLQSEGAKPTPRDGPVFLELVSNLVVFFLFFCGKCSIHCLCSVENRCFPVYSAVQFSQLLAPEEPSTAKFILLMCIYNVWHLLFPVSESILISCQPELSPASVCVYVSRVLGGKGG